MFFGLSYVKLAIIAVVAAAFLGLTWQAKHYHNKWVEVTAQLASKQAELDQALSAAKQCSDNTEQLAKEAQAKQAQVAEAQRQAALTSKKNKALAAQILAMQSSNPNRCEAALDLINQHKSQTKGQ